MAIKVPAFELDRVIQNILLFADSKATRLREVFFEPEGDFLNVYSCDDYVTLTDKLELTEGVLREKFSLSVPDVDSLGDWIKKDRKVVHKYDITLRPKFTGMVFESEEMSTEDGEDNIFLTYTVSNDSAWEIVKELICPENQVLEADHFYVRPERLAKLSRIKADREAPISMRFVDVRGLMVIQFKKGSTAYGAIMPVRPDKVREEFLWQPIAA
jgi:hypothetical protein